MTANGASNGSKGQSNELVERVLNAWPDTAQEPNWADEVLRALDLERVIRQMGGPPRSKAAAEAEEADRIVRSYANALAGEVSDESWNSVTKHIRSGEDGSSPVADSARRTVAGRRARYITASLSCAAAFVVLTRFWLADARGVGLGLSLLLGIVALALLVGASLTLSRAANLVVESRAVVVDYVWLVPSALVLGVVMAGILGRDDQAGDGPLWGVLAVAVAAVATTAVIESLWLRGARPRTAPLSDSLTIPLGSAPLAPAGSPGPEAALLGALYRFTTALATRERHASYRWFATFASLAFVGAVGAGVAGLTALSAQQGAQSATPTPTPSATPTATPTPTQTGREETSSPLTLLAVIALVGAGATALSTGLNPGFEWRSAADRARACDALGREVLTMYRLDLPEYTEHRNVREAVQHVLDRLDKILVAPEGASFWSMVNTGVPARDQPGGRESTDDPESDGPKGGGGDSGTQKPSGGRWNPIP